MSLFKPKQKASVLVGEPAAHGDDPAEQVDAPWLRAGQQFNDTYLRLAAQVANWRMFAFFAIAVAALSVGGAIYIGSKSKFVPYLVEVDKLGQTVAVRALSGNDAVVDPQRLVYREMFDLIENLRTVTTDRDANNDRIEKGYSRLTGAARVYVRSELRKAPPNEVGATKTVAVRVKTALKVTDKSWQLEWEETSYSLAGEVLGTEKWKATIQYMLAPSSDELNIRKNPIGYTVTDLNWMKVI